MSREKPPGGEIVYAYIITDYRIIINANWPFSPHPTVTRAPSIFYDVFE